MIMIGEQIVLVRYFLNLLFLYLVRVSNDLFTIWDLTKNYTSSIKEEETDIVCKDNKSDGQINKQLGYWLSD